METNTIIIEEVAAKLGLDWEPVLTPTYTRYPDGNGGFDHIAVPGNNAVVHNKTKQVLGTVGDKYHIFPNRDLVATVAESYSEVFDKDFNLEHPWDNTGRDGNLGTFGNIGGGYLRGGQAVFCQIHLGETYVGKSGIKRWISVLNTHNGKSSLAFGNGNQVVCCENTFQMAFRELSKFRHSASIKERVEEAVQKIRVMMDLEEQQIDVFDRASRTELTSPMLRQFLDSVIGMNSETYDKASTRKKNQFDKLVSDIDKSIQEQGPTAWALFNGVTRYTNHKLDNKGQEKPKDEWGLVFGQDATINSKAYEELVSVIS